ncbi:calmodulin-binding receptor-like cytoplasmic kinase 1 isoform X2 [Jatropha curcas]|uniref:calmodulin-binding receptor-like cytoplasmic kinase 1 isoform X2 n=1 Tax=Jatropha curcas TaxID=180498 RepID=UPI0009D6C123|nr:calmodulin-binding receptor-like cytoplasmic kinase 1 isoform X2 [Jatropha curcas]
MKKTSKSPHILQSSQRKQIPSATTKHHAKTQTNPVFNYFKKVAGVFTIIFFRRRKVAGAVTTGTTRNNTLVEGVPFSNSTDLSTGSNSKSSSRFKFSSSYGSSSKSSGIVGTISFSIEEIYKATENFSPANTIGEGGFGTVYKGKLKDGSLVAFKRAKKNDNDKRLSLEFKNEVLTLSKIGHLNLVRLYGCVEYGDERIIVVEYVGNGTLREHLDGIRGNGLEIAERLDIAIDVAHAITYLHMYTEKLRAKVADFGFAKLTTEDPGVTHISTQIKGTTGYLDPEYLRTYQLTEKSDVYSFGVLLVELMTGRYPIEPKRPIKERVTTRWAMQKLKEKEAILVMDPMLRRTPLSNIAMEKVLELAKRCVADIRPSRPSMKECGEVLWKIRKDLREKSLSSASASTSHQSANYPWRDAKKSREKTFGIEEGESYKFISA